MLSNYDINLVKSEKGLAKKDKFAQKLTRFIHYANQGKLFRRFC